MIEWTYGVPGLTRYRGMFVPIEHLDNSLVMRIVDRLIDMDIYPHSRAVRITEERVEVEVFPRAIDPTRTVGQRRSREYAYHWGCRCRHCHCVDIIVIRRSWPLLELLAGEDAA